MIDSTVRMHPAVQREVEAAAARVRHPLMPAGPAGERKGAYGLVQATEQVHGIYLPDALFRWYWVERQSCREIAEDLGVHTSTVAHWLKLLGFNQKAILERAARQLQEDPGWALEGQGAWSAPRGR